MAIRKGSLEGLEDAELELLRLALEDFDLGRRRERCSRQDYVAGWLACLKRLKHDGDARKLLLRDLTVAA